MKRIMMYYVIASLITIPISSAVGFGRVLDSYKPYYFIETFVYVEGLLGRLGRIEVGDGTTT